MAQLGIGQKPIVMPHYPHMLPGDTDVWTKFLESELIRIKRVWYDMHVGSAVSEWSGEDDMLKKIARGVTRKRIDVVAAVGDNFWVIEVKPLANMYAVGQVLTYSRLFEKEYFPAGPVQGVIICDRYDEDLLDEFDELQILVIANEKKIE